MIHIETSNVTSKSVMDLSKEEYQDCYNLNFRSNGLMRETLKDIKRNNNNYVTAQTYLIYNKNTLLAWGLIFQLKDSEYTDCYIYVRSNHRRKGLGSKLFQNIYIRYPYAIFHPHDVRSADFFLNCKNDGFIFMAYDDIEWAKEQTICLVG